MVIAFLTYVILIVLSFSRRGHAQPGDAGDFDWHFFVPCRDEEAVIGTTMARLRDRFPQAHVWVIDDDSDDATAALVQERADRDAQVHLVRRRLPDARVGKGAALNSAYRVLREWLGEGADLDRTIVCVIDADGELTGNALQQAAGPTAFGDPAVGAAQTTVWMKNRNDKVDADGRRIPLFARFLVRMQDLEFRTIIAGMQALRGRTSTVGLGGNGQFTRVSVLHAIDELKGQPWHGSLLEDYELGVHVLLAGHQIRHLHDTYVEQEGLMSARRFLTQRTRWAQGNIQCSRYLPELLRSRHVGPDGAVESAYYLLLPFLQVLGFVIWAILGGTLVATILASPAGAASWMQGNWSMLLTYAAVGIAPFAVWGPLYRNQCEPQAPWAMGLVWGVGVWLYSFYVWITSPRAFARVLLNRSGWAKTRRNGEAGQRALVAKEC
nr:glycosyltransferase family 2 protein [Leifsonia sp. C5G2]